MTHQLIFNFDYFSIDRQIELSNFIFTKNNAFRDSFYGLEVKTAIGYSNCIFPHNGCYVYYNKPIDFDIENCDIEEIRDRFTLNNNEKIENFQSFLQFFWFAKDNGINISRIDGKQPEIKWLASTNTRDSYSESTGVSKEIIFNGSELKEAHSIWLKYKSLIKTPTHYERDVNLVHQHKETGFVRSKVKGYDKHFDYNKTNCIERAMGFLDMARNAEYKNQLTTHT